MYESFWDRPKDVRQLGVQVGYQHSASEVEAKSLKRVQDISACMCHVGIRIVRELFQLPFEHTVHVWVVRQPIPILNQMPELTLMCSPEETESDAQDGSELAVK